MLLIREANIITRTLLFVVIISFLQGCFFIIPTGLIIRAIQGPTYCVSTAAYVGSKVKMNDGRTATVTKIKGPISECTNALLPIGADLTFDNDDASNPNKSEVNKDAEPLVKSEPQKTNTEKPDKLHEGGVASEDEHKGSKDKLMPTQKDSTDTNKKLQELDDLHKQGILSDEDYMNAKRRLIGHTSKPSISLPEGWEKLTPTPVMLSGNVIYFAKNRTTDVVLVLSAEKRKGITDLMELAIAKRAKLSNILSNPQPSEVSQIEIKGRKALRFNVAGELKNGQKITYLMTIIEGTTEIVLLNTSTNTANFERQKEAMGQLAENITGL